MMVWIFATQKGLDNEVGAGAGYGYGSLMQTSSLLRVTYLTLMGND